MYALNNAQYQIQIRTKNLEINEYLVIMSSINVWLQLIDETGHREDTVDWFPFPYRFTTLHV